MTVDVGIHHLYYTYIITCEFSSLYLFLSSLHYLG